MKRGMKPRFLMMGDCVVGVDLSADYCAEHEFGIKKMKSRLGIPLNILSDKSNFGIIGRMITVFNQNDFFFEKVASHTCLTFESDRWDKSFGWDNREMDSNPAEIASAWDEESFGIVVENKHADFINELYEAFKNKNIAIWLGGGGVFENAGLVIVIASKVPDDIRHKMLENDEDSYNLKNTAEKTGIYKILEEAGKGSFKDKGYMALSPRWANEKRKDVMFWLNPMDQRNDNYGWFTVKDLKEWAKGRGRIPKKSVN